MTSSVLQLKQIDGEKTEYAEGKGRWVGPCPGCFLKARRSVGVEEAVKATSMEITLPWFFHAGCGKYEVIGDTWVQRY